MKQPKVAAQLKAQSAMLVKAGGAVARRRRRVRGKRSPPPAPAIEANFPMSPISVNDPRIGARRPDRRVFIMHHAVSGAPVPGSSSVAAMLPPGGGWRYAPCPGARTRASPPGHQRCRRRQDRDLIPNECIHAAVARMLPGTPFGMAQMAGTASPGYPRSIRRSKWGACRFGGLDLADGNGPLVGRRVVKRPLVVQRENALPHGAKREHRGRRILVRDAM
jgi:hypothetical protein